MRFGLVRRIIYYECVKMDSFVSENWECHIPEYFLVVSRRGSVYFFWLLRDGTGSSLCQASEIG
jgi:hypothetical protein